MHPEIDKMVKMAQSRGSLTIEQRDMILNKARGLGDDLTEVEFVLSGISLSDGSNAHRTEQNGAAPFQQQATFQQSKLYSANNNQHQHPSTVNAHQQQQLVSGTMVPDTTNKLSLILGIVSTVLGAFSSVLSDMAFIGLGAGIFGIIRSNKEMKQYKQYLESQNITGEKNPFKVAFVLSIIGTCLSGLDILIGFAQMY